MAQLQSSLIRRSFPVPQTKKGMTKRKRKAFILMLAYFKTKHQNSKS